MKAVLEAAVVILIAGLGIVGFVLGRWWTLLVPFLVVPGFYLGLDREWWGYGLGDAWQYAMFGVLSAAVAVTAVGVAVRRRGAPERRLGRGRG